MSAIEMETKVNDLRELRRMADELAGEISALEDELKAHMTATGTDEITGTTFKITWKTVTSSRLDSKALKAEVPDLWARFSKATTSRRFVVA
jgi:predicted phage-related endonuclease